MAEKDERRGVSTGPNARSLNDTIAQTGPGIPDDAASPGYDPVADADTEHDVESKPPPPADEVLSGRR